MTDEQSVLARSIQITGRARRELARRWRDEYEAGSTIRAIADSSGRSYGFVRQLLAESGVTWRARGGAHPRGSKSGDSTGLFRDVTHC